MYKFSPTSQASLEEKRVSVKKHVKANLLFFGILFDVMLICIYFPFKDGKDFGNWEWKEVGKLSSVKKVWCGTST